MRRAIFLTVSLPILAAAFIGAQVGTRPAQQQTQGQSATPGDQPKSTALILGQVVDGTSGQPIADAIVTLNQAGGRGRGPALNLTTLGGTQNQAATQAAATALLNAVGGRGTSVWPMRVMTGGDGRFVFHGLPPGQYQLSAGLTGYTASLNVTAGGGGGGVAGLVLAALAGAGVGGGTSLSLKEGEFATSLKLRLWKHAVISGTVVDDAGEPAIGVNVQVARRAMMGGRARFIPGASARTDDRGAFRINGLVPGTFVVVVPQTQVSIPTAIMSSLMDSLTGNGPAGGGLALLDAMTSGIDPSSAVTGGVRIGDYLVSSSGLQPIMTPDGHLQVFQTTFYPSAASPVQATVMTLKSGEERTEINFQLRLTPTSRVSGVVTGPDGPLANVGVRLVVPGDGTISESEFDVATALTKADGSFTFFGVPPGQFLLRASKQPRPEMPAEMMSSPLLGQMFSGGAGAPKPLTETLFASANVTVAGDVDNVSLQLAPGFHVAGRLEFESKTNRAQPTAQQLQQATILLTPIDGRNNGGSGLGALLGNTPDRVNQQGEFKTKGIQAGKYFLTVSGTGPWVVKSALYGGRDVLDAPLDLNTDVAGVIVTLTDQMATVSGTVTGPGETDLSETTVVLIPFAYKQWITNGMSSRLMRTVTASRSGAYSVSNVPAGDYVAVAIDRSYEGDMQDPAVIETLARLGSRITVTTDPAKIDLTKVRVGK